MTRPEQRRPACPYHGTVTSWTNLVRPGTALAILVVLGWLGACSDPGGPPPPPEPLRELVVSDTAAAARLAGSAPVARTANDAGDEVAYVSLPPGAAPLGAHATIRVIGGAAPLFMPIRDGGFDPIPIAANVGDSIEVSVQDAALRPAGILGVRVRAARPPIVVRTEPPRRKTDVPLNAPLIIVLSEPAAGNTVTTGSVQLFRGASAVEGTVTMFEGTGTLAAFVPAAPLAANTEYRLEVTQAVRDLDGEPLQAPETVIFTTGQSSVGPPAFIQTSPDSTLTLVVGETYQLSATVRDAAGNRLIDPPVTWSIENAPDPTALTVSPTGLLTAHADPYAPVTARVGGLIDQLNVFITPHPAASATLAPTPASVAAGDTIVLTATVRDAAGRTINRPSLAWTSSDSAVATVTAADYDQPTSAIVTGVTAGQVTITATSGTVSGTASTTVAPPRPVASVTLSPASATVISQAMVQLSATLRDANGALISGRPITWQSDNEAVATVGATGIVAGVGIGSAQVTATSEGVSDTATITVTTITFGSLSAGYEQTCGIATNGLAYCWGANFYRQLGNNLPPQDLYPDDPDYAGQYFYDGSFVPVPVNGGLTFSRVSPGGVHTCGLGTNGAAHCWGANDGGQLGIGGDPTPDVCSWGLYTAVSCSSQPLAVAGNPTFSTVAVGEGDGYSPYSGHACGLTANGAAHCWGGNGVGQLGNGTSGNGSAVPLPVTGGLVFADLSLGSTHTCGLTTNGAAYCWGDNLRGKLGSGPGGSASSSVPVPVTGGLTFVSLSVGAWHTCGLTAAGAAYCWGSNFYGQLGDGSTDTSAVPVAVTGGLTFTALSVGGFHTCALTAGGSAYCWGINRYGELGIGSDTGSDQCATGNPFPHPCSRTPVLVLGGFSFATLSAGGVHTCGLTSNGVAYCWGQAGPIGNGAREGTSSVPVKVAGQP